MNNNEIQNNKSVFNDGIGQIGRLNRYWSYCSHYRENGMLDRYLFKLDTVALELITDIQSQDKKDELENLNKLISIAKKINNRSMVYTLLQKKEGFLRCVQDESGKGASYTDGNDDRDDW